MFAFREKCFPHISQLNGFSPVCILKWRTRSALDWNRPSHKSQLKIFGLAGVTYITLGEALWLNSPSRYFLLTFSSEKYFYNYLKISPRKTMCSNFNQIYAYIFSVVYTLLYSTSTRANFKIQAISMFEYL